MKLQYILSTPKYGIDHRLHHMKYVLNDLKQTRELYWSSLEKI